MPFSVAASWASWAWPCGVDEGRAAGEQHLGLEDEAVADDPHVLAQPQRLPQAAEELGAVLRQLLDLAGQRHVQPLAEIGDGRALLVDLLLLYIQGLAQCCELGLSVRICSVSTRTWSRACSLALVSGASAEAAALQLREAEVALRQLRLRQHRLLGRRRRAGSRAGWRDRGCCRARPGGGALGLAALGIDSVGNAALQLLPHLAQGLDVLAQLDELAQLELDRALSAGTLRWASARVRSSSWPRALARSASPRAAPPAPAAAGPGRR